MTDAPIDPLMSDPQWPLLHRNAESLAQASDPVVRARLLADRVGLLARHGFASHAAVLLPEARDVVLDLDDGEAFVRLAISEAITSYHGSMSSSADTFDTALEAASEHRMHQLEAEAAVWAASCRGALRIDVPGTLEFLRFALRYAGAACETTLPRALYEAGNQFDLANLHDDARLWRRDAMRLARRAGDLQLCDAIATYPLHLELIEARAAFAKDALPDDIAANLAERIRAAAGRLSYTAKRAQLHLHLAQSLRLCGRYAEAARLFELYLPQTQDEGSTEPDMLAIRSDFAVCLLHQHDSRAATQERNELRRALDGQMPHHSRAALLTNLAELERLHGRPEAGARLSIQAAALWGEHEHHKKVLRVAIDSADLHACWTATAHSMRMSR